VSRLVAINHLTLDGVMQAPGRPDEDRSGGFAHGGWGASRTDEVMGRALGERMGRGRALLLGRRTYQQLLEFWPSQPPNPYTEALDRATKYVVSTTLREPLPWRNSVLVSGDAAESVAGLKAEPGGDLTIMGSGELMQTLMRHDLVDEHLLMIHPVVLGTGARLFREGGPDAALALVDCTTTTTGVVIATYRPTRTGAGTA